MNRKLRALAFVLVVALGSGQTFSQPPTDEADPRLATLPELLAGSPTELNFTGWPVGDEVFREVARKCPNLVDLQISGTQITDAGVQHLASLKKLEVLIVSSTEITDEAFGIIGRSFPALEYLVAGNHTRVTNEGIRRLEPLAALRGLTLYDLPLNDDCCESIARHRRLRDLNLANTLVTDAGVARLVNELPELRQLHLNGTPTTDASIHLISQRLPSLQKLGLGRGATDASIATLVELKNLSSLNTTSAKISDAGLRTAADLPLQDFRAKGPTLSLAGLSAFSGSRTLHTLIIHDAAFQPGSTDFAWLRSLPKLEWLALYDCGLGDDEARQIAQALRGRKLSSITLGNSGATPVGRKALEEAHAVKGLRLETRPFWKFW